MSPSSAHKQNNIVKVWIHFINIWIVSFIPYEKYGIMQNLLYFFEGLITFPLYSFVWLCFDKVLHANSKSVSCPESDTIA